MKKKMIRSLALFLACFCLITVLPLPAAALRDGDLVYTLGTGNTVTVTRCDATDEIYTMPETVGGYPIHTLAKGFMNANDNVKTLIIPNTVKRLQDQCFRGHCPEYVLFVGEGVPDMGAMTFYLADGLKYVSLPAELKTLSSSMFRTSTLESVDLPQGLTKIGFEAFRECKNLRGIDIPQSVTSIGSYAFYSDIWLTEDVYLGPNVTSVGEEAFRNCYRLGKITIMNESCTIGHNAFYQCTYPLYLYGRKDSPALAYCEGDGEVFPIFVCATAADHIYPETWVTALEPTTYYFGLSVRCCENCGITEKRSIPKLSDTQLQTPDGQGLDASSSAPDIAAPDNATQEAPVLETPSARQTPAQAPVPPVALSATVLPRFTGHAARAGREETGTPRAEDAVLLFAARAADVCLVSVVLPV